MLTQQQIQSVPKLRNLFRSMEISPAVFGLQFFPEQFYKPFAKFHKIMIKEFLKSTARITVALIPRGFGKSIIISFLLTMWLIVFKNARFIMLISMTSTKAQELLDDIKAACESEIFVSTFGNVIGSKWSAKQAHIYSEEWGFNCIVRAAGMDEQHRGSRKGAFRIQYGIIDDPEDDKDTRNPDLITVKEEFISKVILPAIVEKDKDDNYGRIWWLGTTLAQDCVVRRVSKYKNTKVVTFPALIDTQKMADKLDIPIGSSIWEDMFTTDRLREIRDELFDKNMSGVWWSEYMLDPRGVDELIFRKQPKITTINDIRDSGAQMFMAIDSAFETKRINDSSAIVVAGFDNKANLYVAESVSGKFEADKFINKVIEILSYYANSGMPIWKIGIESISFKMTKMVLQEKIRAKGFHVSIVPLKHRIMHKIDRIKILIPISDFEQLYIRKKHEVLLAQMQKFPSMKGGIDELDALAYIPTLAYKGNVPKEKKKEELPLNSVKRDIQQTMVQIRLENRRRRIVSSRSYVHRVGG